MHSGNFCSKWEKFPRHGKISTAPLHGCAAGLRQNLKSFHDTARLPILRMASMIARILHFLKFSSHCDTIPGKVSTTPLHVHSGNFYPESEKLPRHGEVSTAPLHCRIFFFPDSGKSFHNTGFQDTGGGGQVHWRSCVGDADLATASQICKVRRGSLGGAVESPRVPAGAPKTLDQPLGPQEMHCFH